MIRAKGGSGKLTGQATVIRKNGKKETVQITATVSEEQLNKLTNNKPSQEK